MQRALIVIFASAICANAAVLRNGTDPKSLLLGRPKSGPYGLPNCPCIGIDNREGEVMATMKGGKQVPYPADMGGRCKAWDADKNPKCLGDKPPTWCESKWCYVDPCNCDKVSPYPKPAVYLPDSQYQGKPVHFSYATCDGMDSYSETGAGSNYETIEKTCAVQVDSSKWGHEDCRCIGIAPQPGNMQVEIKGKKVAFPADTGGQCKTHEKEHHPECKSATPPDWCNQAWCYVDPCTCTIPISPKTNTYVPEANYQGRPVYYSYATCGGTDSWTGGNHDSACVNLKDKEACEKLDKCAWKMGKESHCLGKELVEVCNGAFSLKAIMALALPCLGFFY